MCILLRFPIEQCRPVSVASGRRSGEVVIFPGVRIEREITPVAALTGREPEAERREG